MITGAGGGIGRAAALALANEGAELAVCDIAPAALDNLKTALGARGENIIACAVDVSDRDAVAHFAREVCERRRAPDILVNSAGVYISGTILDLTPDDWTWALSVNLFGVIHACHYFLPPMIARGGGGNIVNLVSMYGYWPSPGVAGYLTSKFGVFGFSEALREDLRAHNISVSTVCPGMINTGIVRNMRIRNAPGREDAVRAALQNAYTRRNYGPEPVAAAIVGAVKRNKKLVLVSPEARIMYFLERFFPALSRVIARRAAKRMFSP